MIRTEELLQQLRQGSEGAFEAIFRAYYGQVFAAAYRLLGSGQEAEDVAQEAFLRLYRYPLPAGREHNLAGWLLRVATNLAYNALRSRKRRQDRERRATEEWADASSGRAALDPDAGERVREVLATLPERQVQILFMRQAGLSYAEVADALGVAPGSVGTLVARAERAFRERWEKGI